MGVLGILLLIVFAISAVLLLIVVLIQDEQGEGIGGIFGGGGMSGSIGNRKGNFLTRVTTALGIIFLVSCFGLAWINRSPYTGDIEGAARQAEREEESSQWWILPDESAETTPEE